MDGTKRSGGSPAIRRKKAQYRSWHRGMREVDLLLGTFADARIDTLGPGDLDDYEDLLDVQDGELLAWMTGQTPVPARYDTPVFRRIQAFRRVMPF